MKAYQCFLSEYFQFLKVKFSIYLNRRVCLMKLDQFFLIPPVDSIIDKRRSDCVNAKTEMELSCSHKHQGPF